MPMVFLGNGELDLYLLRSGIFSTSPLKLQFSSAKDASKRLLSNIGLILG